jgi:hypothetical protein
MDLYNLIRSFGNFLKTEVEVSSGMIDMKIHKGDHWDTVSVPGCTFEVEISNTAPVESDYPLIAFMGVGLRVKFPKAMHRTITRMRNESNFEVDVTNAPQNPSPIKEGERIDTEEYPAITQDEKSHGYVLFPNQSIKYKLSLTEKECPDVKELKLWVEGTISGRHLYHQRKEITTG